SIEDRESLRRATPQEGRRADGVSNHGGDGGGLDTLAGNIAQVERPGVLGELVDVVEVSAHGGPITERAVHGPDIHRGNRGKRRWQEGRLQHARLVRALPV